MKYGWRYYLCKVFRKLHSNNKKSERVEFIYSSVFKRRQSTLCQNSKNITNLLRFSMKIVDCLIFGTLAINIKLEYQNFSAFNILPKTVFCSKIQDVNFWFDFIRNSLEIYKTISRHEFSTWLKQIRSSVWIGCNLLNALDEFDFRLFHKRLVVGLEQILHKT